MAEKALATYLKDHFAGARGGLALAERIASGAEDEDERKRVEEVAAQIKEERELLSELMTSLDATPSRLKTATAWTGEKFSALKLNTSRGDRRVLEYEAMIMGVTGKLQLWRSLSQISNGEGAGLVSDERLTQLARQAESQRVTLEELHGRTARAVLG
jgi:hypothetical protein